MHRFNRFKRRLYIASVFVYFFFVNKFVILTLFKLKILERHDSFFFVKIKITIKKISKTKKSFLIASLIYIIIVRLINF